MALGNTNIWLFVHTIYARTSLIHVRFGFCFVRQVKCRSVYRTRIKVHVYELNLYLQKSITCEFGKWTLDCGIADIRGRDRVPTCVGM